MGWDKDSLIDALKITKMSQNKQCKKHSPHFRAEGMPSWPLSNSHLEVIHSSTTTSSTPSPTAPVFIAEHQYVVWNIPLFSVGLLPQLCPHSQLAQPQPTLWGRWMGRVGEKRESPKAGGQQANSYFLSGIKEKGLVSVRTARVIVKPSTLTWLQLQLFNYFKTVQTKN